MQKKCLKDLLAQYTWAKVKILVTKADLKPTDLHIVKQSSTGFLVVHGCMNKLRQLF